MVFNPSSMNRVLHVWTGAFIAGAFLVLSISAYYILKRRHEDFAQRSFRIALVVATCASLTQLFLGHRSAEIVALIISPPNLPPWKGISTLQRVWICTCWAM